MKAYRHFAAATTGKIDTEGLCRRMAELHGEVEISDFTTCSGAKAAFFSGIIEGTVTEKNIPMSVDLIVFPSGVIIFETCFHGDPLPGEVLAGDFLKAKVPIRTGSKEEENPIYMHCWLYFFELMRFSDLVSRISDVNIVDQHGQTEIQKRIAEASLISTWFLGDELLFELLGRDVPLAHDLPGRHRVLQVHRDGAGESGGRGGHDDQSNNQVAHVYEPFGCGA